MKKSRKTIFTCLILSIFVIVSFAYLFSALKPFIIKDRNPVIELVPDKEPIQNSENDALFNENHWQEDVFNKSKNDTNTNSFQNYEEEYLIYQEAKTPTGEEILVYDNDQIWTTSTDIDIFKLKAEEENIVSINNDKIIAPGSENEYSFYIKNNGATLLNYDVDVNKKVAEILPIQATQFSTYPFHTKQDIASENYEKEKEIHKMLLEKGSEPFSNIDANLFYFGNFLFAYATVVFQSNRLIKPEMLNSAEFFDIKEKNKRTIASFKYEAMKEILNQYGILIRNVEFSRHTDDFINVINDVLTCSNKCYVLAFTGNSQVAPYQWVLIKKFDEDTIKNLKVKNEEAKFMCINSDSSYDYAEYHIKDISEIIVIKDLGK